MLSYSMEKQLYLLGMVLYCISQCYRFLALWYYLNLMLLNFNCRCKNVRTSTGSDIRFDEDDTGKNHLLMVSCSEIQKLVSTHCIKSNVANYNKIIKKRKDLCFQYYFHIFVDSGHQIGLKNILQHK